VNKLVSFWTCIIGDLVWIGEGKRTNGAGGMLDASTSCGMLVHVLTQWNPSSCRVSIARPWSAGVNSARAANAAVKMAMMCENRRLSQRTETLWASQRYLILFIESRLDGDLFSGIAI
jgi:hypothetical protein